MALKPAILLLISFAMAARGRRNVKQLFYQDLENPSNEDLYKAHSSDLHFPKTGQVIDYTIRGMEAKPCSPPTLVDQAVNGSCLEGNTIADGSSCTLQCLKDYVPSVGSLTCFAGTLYPERFACQPSCATFRCPEGQFLTNTGSTIITEGSCCKVPINYVLIGNAREEKSIIFSRLNVATPLTSTDSFLGGMTSQVDVYTHEGDRYLDVPGLAQKELQEHAVEAIKAALKLGGRFKIFFVIKLEKGRLRPDDVATIQLVIESCKDIPQENGFGIIINQLDQRTLEKLQQQEAQNVITKIINNNLRKVTDKLLYIPFKTILSVKDQSELDTINQAVRTFVDGLADIVIEKKNVLDIPLDSWETKKQNATGIIKKMQEDSQALRKSLMDNAQKHLKTMPQMDDESGARLRSNQVKVGKIRIEREHQRADNDHVKRMDGGTKKSQDDMLMNGSRNAEKAADPEQKRFKPMLHIVATNKNLDKRNTLTLDENQQSSQQAKQEGKADGEPAMPEEAIRSQTLEVTLNNDTQKEREKKDADRKQTVKLVQKYLEESRPGMWLLAGGFGIMAGTVTAVAAFFIKEPKAMQWQRPQGLLSSHTLSSS